MKRKKIWLVVLFIVLVAIMSACGQRETPTLESANPVPAFTLEQLKEHINFNSANFITSDDGDALFRTGLGFPGDGTGGTSFVSTESPDAVWASAPPVTHGNEQFTLFAAAMMPGGNLGILNIPRMGLTVNVYDIPDEIEAMRTGVAHLRETSAWVGNVGIAGHDSGQGDFFRNLNQLEVGDEIRFTTALGTKTYSVVSSMVVHESNWELLQRTADNRITLVTCVQFDGSRRLLVQAVEVS